MKISSEFIEELKFRNRIEDVVSQYVNMKRSGSNLTGLCPFHSEKTPSFFVSPSRSSFHCFGCGAGGDVITFVMQADNLDYISALESLAHRCGMEMPQDEEDTRNVLKKSRLHEMNKAAAKFFNSCLYTDSAENARKYLDKRGITSAAVKRFGLGYAPDSFDALSKHMHSLGYNDFELKAAFLAGKSEKTNRYYDYFRNRIMFPIIDVLGNVVAFGGRAIGDVQPKYLNSSDTPAFKKSKNLFALNYAKNTSYDYLILCEGYMDVIAMHMAGFDNAVATLGTALTSEQARILAKYKTRLVLSYDSDESGINATNRALPILNEVGIDVKVLTVKDAKDPDEYIKKFGKDKFRELIEGSDSKLDFLCNTISKQFRMDVPEDKIKAGSELVKAVASIYSNVEKDIYINQICKRFGFEKNAFSADVERLKRSRAKKNESNVEKKAIADSLGYTDTVNRQKSSNLKAVRAEEAIIGILLLNREDIAKIKDGSISLTADDFVTEFSKKVFEALMELGADGEIGLLNEKFGFQEMSRIEQMLEDRKSLSGNGVTVLQEYIDKLKSVPKQAQTN